MRKIYPNLYRILSDTIQAVPNPELVSLLEEVFLNSKPLPEILKLEQKYKDIVRSTPKGSAWVHDLDLNHRLMEIRDSLEDILDMEESKGKTWV